ncbi:hypothetical protein BDZ91DRAFT_765661 [Kalaharituber pfeilii]|nr:hypothetical protein BDZ91DRAFT_765661 [Kalaharituber pfeilii]
MVPSLPMRREKSSAVLQTQIIIRGGPETQFGWSLVWAFEVAGRYCLRGVQPNGGGSGNRGAAPQRASSMRGFEKHYACYAVDTFRPDTRRQNISRRKAANPKKNKAKPGPTPSQSPVHARIDVTAAFSSSVAWSANPIALGPRAALVEPAEEQLGWRHGEEPEKLSGQTEGPQSIGRSGSGNEICYEVSEVNLPSGAQGILHTIRERPSSFRMVSRRARPAEGRSYSLFTPGNNLEEAGLLCTTAVTENISSQDASISTPPARPLRPFLRIAGQDEVIRSREGGFFGPLTCGSHGASLMRARAGPGPGNDGRRRVEQRMRMQVWVLDLQGQVPMMVMGGRKSRVSGGEWSLYTASVYDKDGMDGVLAAVTVAIRITTIGVNTIFSGG